jgi:hypothetical protein
MQEDLLNEEYRRLANDLPGTLRYSCGLDLGSFIPGRDA